MKTITAGDCGYHLFCLRGEVSVSKHVVTSQYIEIKEKFPSAKYSRAEICIVNHPSNTGSIFITDNNGTTHSIFINEMELVCLERDEVIAVWSIGNADKRGPVIAIKNLKTTQSFFFEAALKKMYRNTLVYLFCVSFSAIAGIGSKSYSCAFLMIILGLAVAYCIKQYLAYLWADKFKKNFDFEIGW
ncbi:MAG: hypothetical protein ABI402_10330 [Ferruginibacter sp.]